MRRQSVSRRRSARGSLPPGQAACGRALEVKGPDILTAIYEARLRGYDRAKAAAAKRRTRARLEPPDRRVIKQPPALPAELLAIIPKDIAQSPIGIISPAVKTCDLLFRPPWAFSSPRTQGPGPGAGAVALLRLGVS